MVVGINLIALSDERGDGSFRYIKMILRHMGQYHIEDCLFVIYKQKQITDKYIDVPNNLSVKFVNVPTLGTGIRRILFEQFNFYKYIIPCDVFYSYCSSLPLFVKAKKVFTLHDVYSYTVDSRFGLIRKAYLRIMTSLYVRVSDKILTVSENSEHDIVKYLGVDRSKIIITSNFILRPKVEILEKMDFTDANGRLIKVNAPYFLYVGSLHNGKNIKGLCESFNKFNEHNTNYSLVLVGKILENEETYSNLLVSNPNIIYLGYQPREVVETLLCKCYATVLFSFYEGFGIPPLEGFYYSKPSIVSKTSSLPEVVGKAGVYVDPNSVSNMALGFERLIENYEECVQHTSEQIEKYSPDKSVESFLNALGVSFTKK